MIPDEAVEAAVAAYLTEYNYNAEEIVKLVLEAAAPYMLVEAKAGALEEAAQTIENYAKDGADADASPYETAGWLRARAAKLRE